MGGFKRRHLSKVCNCWLPKLHAYLVSFANCAKIKKKNLWKNKICLGYHKFFVLNALYMLNTIFNFIVWSLFLQTTVLQCGKWPLFPRVKANIIFLWFTYSLFNCNLHVHYNSSCDHKFIVEFYDDQNTFDPN